MSFKPFKLHAANELAESIRQKLGPSQGTPGTLMAKFKDMKTAQASMGNLSAGESKVMNILDPKTSELVCVINANVMSLIEYDLPKTFEKLLNSCVDLKNEEHEGVTLYGFEDTKGLIAALRFCLLEQTGDRTDNNRSKFMQEFTGKVTRTLQLGPPVNLVTAHHWPEKDKASAEFLMEWMEVSMELLELHHMLIYSLHVERFMEDPKSSGGFVPGSCNAVVRDKVIECYNKRPSKEKGKKAPKASVSDPESLMKVKEWLESTDKNDEVNFQSVVDGLMTTDAKSRIISSPFSRNTADEPQVKFTSVVNWNRLEQGDFSDREQLIRDEWEGVKKAAVLRMHKLNQRTDGYLHKKVPWSADLYEKLSSEVTGEVNHHMWRAIDDPDMGLIAKGVIPESNNKIKILNSSGEELVCPLEQCPMPLSSFQAAIAYEVLQAGGSMGPIVLLSQIGMTERCLKNGMPKTENRHPVYYANVKTFQPILPTQYLKQVTAATYEYPESKKGQQTPPPTFENQFDDPKRMFHRFQHIWQGKKDNVTNIATMKRKYDDFAVYASDENGDDASKRQEIDPFEE